MNNKPDEWYKFDFEEWVSKQYRVWLNVKLPLEAAIEKRDKTEGQNE